jgi:hypothetical protein
MLPPSLNRGKAGPRRIHNSNFEFLARSWRLSSRQHRQNAAPPTVPAQTRIERSRGILWPSGCRQFLDKPDTVGYR